MADIFDSLCGESGVVNQINDTQAEIREAVAQGKNALYSVKKFADDVKTLQDNIENNPEVVERRLQEDIKNLLSQESLANPSGTVAQLLDIRAAYQEAGPAIERVVSNVERFIQDPLGTPLSLCEDIPNIVKVGGEVKELAQPSVVPDKLPKAGDKKPFKKDIGYSDFQVLPRFDSKPISEAIKSAGRFTDQPKDGDANKAALQ